MKKFELYILLLFSITLEFKNNLIIRKLDEDTEESDLLTEETDEFKDNESSKENESSEENDSSEEIQSSYS